MSTHSPQKIAAITAIKQLEQALLEARKLADHAVESYQQEKNKLITMRTDADNEIREVKLQCDNTLNQLRQHIARTHREYRRERDMLRRKWLGIEEPVHSSEPDQSEETDSH